MRLPEYLTLFWSTKTLFKDGILMLPNCRRSGPYAVYNCPVNGTVSLRIGREVWGTESEAKAHALQLLGAKKAELLKQIRWIEGQEAEHKKLITPGT